MSDIYLDSVYLSTFYKVSRHVKTFPFPFKCTFKRCIDYVDITGHFFARFFQIYSS